MGLLHNLTRSHDIASLKIKEDNREESGTIAWSNLKSFFKEEDEEYKSDVLASALTVERCTNMSQLQSRLDQWINRVSRAIKLNPDCDRYLDDSVKFIKLKRLVPESVENTIRTNKIDYPDYEAALRYVKSLLKQMYDKSHPAPMDVDAIGQKEENTPQDKQAEEEQ